jgi:hypothetical protein
MRQWRSKSALRAVLFGDIHAKAVAESLLCRDRRICRPGYSVRDHLYDQHPARYVHAAQVAAQRIVTARREWRNGITQSGP